MTIALLLLAVLWLSYANGSNDNFKAVATIYGSSTLSYRAALGLATAAQLAGSVASIFLAGMLLEAFSGRWLLTDTVVADERFLLAVGVAAAATVLLATRLGMPVSTTHALIGGLVGASLAFFPAEIRWSGLAGRFLVPLLVVPALATAGAAIIYPAARGARRRLGVNEVTCLCVGEEYEPVQVSTDGTMVVARTGLRLTAAQAVQCRRLYAGHVVGVSAQRVVDGLHLVSGAALGFARGLNDTPKILALLVAARWSGLDLRIGLGLVAVAMAVGGAVGSRRIAATLGKRITEMNRGQGLVANVVASGLVICASVVGMPVSTTHVSTGAIFGIGLWTGRAHVNVVAQIIAAWLATCPLALLLGYAAGTALLIA